MRAIGAGSEAARLVAMDRLMTMYGSLPDFGKQNALWDMCAETVGYRNASRYAVPPGEDETPTVDASIAQLENQALLKGGEINILDGQNNLVHCKAHLAAEMPLIEQAQVDPNMLMEILPGLNALNQHTTAHVEKLSTDPQMQAQSAAFRQQIQQADEIIHNGMMHLQKMQRQMAAQKGGNGAPPAIGPDGQPVPALPGPNGEQALDPQVNMKIRSEIAYREAKIQSMNEQAQARLQIEQTKAAQKLAIQDAEAASKMIQRRLGVMMKVRISKIGAEHG